MAFLIPIQDDLLSSSTFFRFCAVLLVVWIFYGAALAIYRLYFSPIARFPGPKLAGLTQYYESYYDLIAGGGGNFTRQIKKMHDEYGIVHRSPRRQTFLTSFRHNRPHKPLRDPY